MKICKYCGSSVKKSKKGNLYCSNICWTKEPYKSQREEDRLDGELQAILHDDWGNRD